MGGRKPGKRKNAAIQMIATAGNAQKMISSPVVRLTGAFQRVDLRLLWPLA